MYHDPDRETPDETLGGVARLGLTLLTIALMALAFVFLFTSYVKAADLSDGYKDGGRSRGIVAGLLPQGFYASVGLGETFVSSDVPAAGLSLASKGLSGDLRFGYDALLGPSKFTFGPLVGVGFQDVNGKTLSGSEKWNWEIGARAGRVFNTSDLLYMLVAYNQQRVGLTGTGYNTTNDGVKLGGGIEFDIAPGLTLGTELDYRWFGTYTPAAGVNVTATDMSGKARLGLRF